MRGQVWVFFVRIFAHSEVTAGNKSISSVYCPLTIATEAISLFFFFFCIVGYGVFNLLEMCHGTVAREAWLRPRGSPLSISKE